MDFNGTPQEAEFRAQARNWLENNAERKTPGAVYKYKRGEPELIPAARAWEAKKYAGGFSGIALPKEYGGRSETRLQQIIFSEEEADYLIPPPIFSISHGMAVPTMLTYATEQQKQRYVPATLRGDEIRCQFFRNRRRDRTLPGYGPVRCAMAMTGSSMARRSGPLAHITRIWRSWSPAVTPMRPNTRGSFAQCEKCARPSSPTMFFIRDCKPVDS